MGKSNSLRDEIEDLFKLKHLVGMIWGRELTLEAGFPYIVCVFETWNNIMADLESEHQTVTASFFQSKP